MSEQPYQTFKPLPTHSYDALRDSIKELGILNPITVTEKGFNGGIVDGHTRYALAKELGIVDEKIPRTVVAGLNYEQLRLLRNLNLARLHLSSADKRQVIREQILETPNFSDRRIAKELGVSNSTVSSLRRDMVARSELCDTHSVLGEDNILRRRPIIVRNPSRYEMAMLKENPETVELMQEKGIKNVTYAQRLINLATKTNHVPDSILDENRIKLHCADIRERDALDFIAEDSISACILDAPYEKRYLSPDPDQNLYVHISRIAERVLLEGGSCCVMTGQAVLPEALEALRTHLMYHWLITYLYSKTPLLAHKKVFPSSKPIIWMTKGIYKGKLQADTIQTPLEGEDWKELHEHGQSITAMAALIKMFVPENGVCLDMTMGAGTTGVAVLRAGGGRSFIGVDQNPQHVEAARLRLKAELLDIQQDG